MASYGKIYEFVRDSQNGAEIHIVISKKNYAGESAIRPLGRAPLLKRENNGQVFGTSLEIYAECKVDGEFAQFYTSSADEYKVEVYKDDSRIWSGFISPELYSEPDIAPPYDVQIIATDGLGELRNYEFENTGVASVYDHLSQLISHTGLPLETVMASDLRYYDGASASEAPAILDFRIDLSHEDGASCYDVLQNLLSSLNASITQFNDRWFLFRETDFIRLASADGLKTFIPGGIETLMDVASFGSAKTCAWWPIGQLSSVIEPAKNRLILISPNSYKENVLDDSWTAENGASYDEAEGAYILPDEGSYITQKLDFAGEEVGYRLALRVSARNVGSGDEDQALGVRVVIDGRSYAGERQYWLIQPASSDRGIGSYMWKTSEGTVEAELAVPSDSDTSADAQDIDIILPLYRNDSRSYIYAKTVEVTVYNPAGIHDIYVYGVSLSKYDQFDGYQANVVLNNGAREEGSSIDLSLSDGSLTPAAGNVFMSGIPLLPEADEAIASWSIGATPAEDYIRMMAKDYSRMVALPRMSYKGVLNVPRASIPVLFVRDNTLYFPRTYSYDLYKDELEVDLVSIPAADLSIESLQIAQIADARGVPSSGGSGSGGGIGGIDLSKYVTIERLASMWQIDDMGNLVAEKQVVIKNNLIVEGDSSSGGTGQDTPVIGTVTGVEVNGIKYTDVSAGILDLSDAFNNVSVDLSNYYTRKEVDDKIAGIDFSPYATTTYVNTAIANLINGAPSTLDTLKEIADALADNADVVAALDAAIGTKADASALEALGKRVTADENNIATLFSTKADKATTLAGYGIKDAYTKTETDNLLKKYLLLEAASQTIKGDIRIEGNLVVTGDSSSGGSGEDTPAIGTVTGIMVNGQTYNPTAGIVTIPDYPTTLEWDAIGGKPSFAAVATSGKYSDLSGRPTIPSLDGYATESWVLEKIPSTLPASGGNADTVDSVHLEWSGSQAAADTVWLAGWTSDGTKIKAVKRADLSVNYATTAGSAPASDVYAWAKASSKPSYTKAEVGLGNVENTALSTWPGTTNITTLGTITSGTWNGSTIGVAYGGTGKTSLTSGYALIGNGTSAVSLRAITNNTSATAVTASTNLITANTLYYHKGNSNITTVGTITSGTWNGTAIANSYLANSAITIAGNSVSLGGSVTAATLLTSIMGSSALGSTSSYLYWSGTAWTTKALGSLAFSSTAYAGGTAVTLNGTSKAASTASFYAPTTVGTSGYVLTSAGSGAPTWTAQSSLSVGYATSAGDSDMLDGYHISDVGPYVFGSTAARYLDKSLDLDNVKVASHGGWWSSYDNTDYINAPIRNFGLLVARINTVYTAQLILPYGSVAQLKYRTQYFSSSGTVWGSWKTIAFTDSDITGNAATATKLQTTRTLWGQSFNGSAAVTGSLSSVGSITFSADSSYDIGSSSVQARYVYASWVGAKTGGIFQIGANNSYGITLNTSNNVTIGSSDLAGTSAKLAVSGRTRIYRSASSTEYLDIYLADISVYYNGYDPDGYSNHYFQSNGTTRLAILGNSGNVGIGTTSPAYKLDVNGDVRINGNLIVTGDSSSGSDIRFKEVIEDKTIKIEDIANAPLFTFKWNDRDDDSIHLGTSAQYWETVTPWLVKGEDFKTLDYATLGVAIGISLANKTMNLEDRVKILEDENKALKAEINRLRRHDN